MNDLYTIENRNYALSGGTGALGSSIALYLVQNGAKVILLGRSAEKLEAKRNELNTIVPNSTHTFEVNVLNEEEISVVSKKIAKEFKHLDGLINLAGGNIPEATLKPNQSIHDIEISAIQKVVDINLFGTVIPSIILSELMAKQKYGTIINISSMASKQSISRVLGYSMAKAGVDIFTKWMANDLASKFGIKYELMLLLQGFLSEFKIEGS